MRRQKSHADGRREGRKEERTERARGESPAISYESDFLPSVKNSRCGIATHGGRRRPGQGLHSSF